MIEVETDLVEQLVALGRQAIAHLRMPAPNTADARAGANRVADQLVDLIDRLNATRALAVFTDQISLDTAAATLPRSVTHATAVSMLVRGARSQARVTYQSLRGRTVLNDVELCDIVGGGPQQTLDGGDLIASAVESLALALGGLVALAEHGRLEREEPAGSA